MALPNPPCGPSLCFHPVYGYSGLDCSNQYTLYPICQGGGYIHSNK